MEISLSHIKEIATLTNLEELYAIKLYIQRKKYIYI